MSQPRADKRCRLSVPGERAGRSIGSRPSPPPGPVPAGAAPMPSDGRGRDGSSALAALRPQGGRARGGLTRTQSGGSGQGNASKRRSDHVPSPLLTYRIITRQLSCRIIAVKRR
ncbi:Rod shape-determining protein MreC [Hyphomicrobiales bacterium]|nr:Rod shape-determining protein MreC [Hyphomicrobiales bacterium]CAH1699608.1 Rod shape-determining protein MreC [Hyphomicrobiales bacterium]CAI0343960.1 hypothetical protein BO1005MUT1_300156 [Hyphomicrobiales bacterium]